MSIPCGKLRRRDADSLGFTLLWKAWKSDNESDESLAPGRAGSVCSDGVDANPLRRLVWLCLSGDMAYGEGGMLPPTP